MSNEAITPPAAASILDRLNIKDGIVIAAPAPDAAPQPEAIIDPIDTIKDGSIREMALRAKALFHTAIGNSAYRSAEKYNRLMESLIIRYGEGATEDPRTAADYDKEDAPEPRPILTGLFDVERKVTIIAPSKARKSWLFLQMALAVSEGMPFLNWAAPRPLKVLYLQLEIHEDSFHGRMKKAMKAMGLSGKAGANLIVYNGRGKGHDIDYFMSLVEKHSPDMVMIDPIYKLQDDGDENATSGWAPIFKQFDRMCRMGCAVVYIHHDAKGNAGDRNASDRGSGSNIVGRDYDCGIILTHHKDTTDEKPLLVVTAIKRDYAPEAEYTIQWADGIFGVSDAEPIKKTSYSERAQKQDDAKKKPPSEFYLPQVAKVFAGAGRKTVTKTKMVLRLRNDLAVTKEVAEEILDDAVEGSYLYSNGGKGLHRRMILFATSPQDLLEGMRAANGGEIKHDEIPCLLPLFDATDKQGGENS